MAAGARVAVAVAVVAAAVSGAGRDRATRSAGGAAEAAAPQRAQSNWQPQRTSAKLLTAVGPPPTAPGSPYATGPVSWAAPAWRKSKTTSTASFSATWR